VATNAITGAKVLESSLGQVPSAATADHATAADNATNADHAATADLAANASKFGGVDSSVLGTSVILLGHAFRPLDSTTPWTIYTGAGITSASTSWFIAQVSLPQGARVTSITQYYHTSPAVSTGEVDLVRCP
jgi:hypothetical protein